MNKFKDIQKRLAKDHSLIYLDIETRPMKAWIWGLGKQVVTHKQIAEESKIISIQWMFEGDKKVSYLTWDKKQDDKKMLELFVDIANTAKVAITQNGKDFDLKVLRWRLNVHQLKPLNDLVIIDTLKLSRQAFRPASHKLDYRSKIYGLGGKIRMELEDWIAVVERKKGALEKMVKYGCKDIPDLRSIFWRELPLYPKLPISLAVLLYPKEKDARDRCPKCASNRQSRFNTYPTMVNNKRVIKCRNCGNIWKDSRVAR